MKSISITDLGSVDFGPELAVLESSEAIDVGPAIRQAMLRNPPPADAPDHVIRITQAIASIYVKLRELADLRTKLELVITEIGQPQKLHFFSEFDQATQAAAGPFIAAVGRFQKAQEEARQAAKSADEAEAAAITSYLMDAAKVARANAIRRQANADQLSGQARDAHLVHLRARAAAELPIFSAQQRAAQWLIASGHVGQCLAIESNVRRTLILASISDLPSHSQELTT
ncbi:MAG: hypothetical protein JSS51_01415 [Planctomycetes bacterium]|nr:hypothetical protein [Planctomycetota bacterium]